MASSGSGRNGRHRSILKGSRNSVGGPAVSDLTDRIQGVGFAVEEANNENENPTTNFLSIAGRKRVSFGQRQIKEFQIQQSFTESPISSILQDANQTMTGEVDMEMSLGNEDYTYIDPDGLTDGTVYGNVDMSTTGFLGETFGKSKPNTKPPTCESMHQTKDQLNITTSSMKFDGLPRRSKENRTIIHEVDMEMTYGVQNIDYGGLLGERTVYGGSAEMSTSLGLGETIVKSKPKMKSDRLPRRNKENTTMIHEVDMEMTYGIQNIDSGCLLGERTVYGGSAEMSTTVGLGETFAKSKPNIKSDRLPRRNKENRTIIHEVDMDMTYGVQNIDSGCLLGERTVYGGSAEMSTTASLGETFVLPKSVVRSPSYADSPASRTRSSTNQLKNPKSGINPHQAWMRSPSFVPQPVASAASTGGQLIFRNPDAENLRNLCSMKRNESKPKNAAYGKFSNMKTPKRKIYGGIVGSSTREGEINLKIQPHKQLQLVSTMAQTSFALGPGSSVDVQTSPMVFCRLNQDAMMSIGTSPMEQLQNHRSIATGTMSRIQSPNKNETFPTEYPRDQSLNLILPSPVDQSRDRSVIKPISPHSITNFTNQLHELSIDSKFDSEIDREGQDLNEPANGDEVDEEAQEKTSTGFKLLKHNQFSVSAINQLHDLSIDDRFDEEIDIQEQDQDLNEPVNGGEEAQSIDNRFDEEIDIEEQNQNLNEPVNGGEEAQDEKLSHFNLSSSFLNYLKHYSIIRGLDKARMLTGITLELIEMQPNVYSEFIQNYRQAFTPIFIESVESNRARIACVPGYASMLHNC